MSNLKALKLFLLDMDGTIYLDNDLFDGVTDFLEHVRAIGGKYIFLTSTDATILYLNKKTYQKIYAFGTTSFKEQLRAAGLPITDKLEDGIDCLCMGFDSELTFQKLGDACILLNRGVDYIATNPDWVCPT